MVSVQLSAASARQRVNREECPPWTIDRWQAVKTLDQLLETSDDSAVIHPDCMPATLAQAPEDAFESCAYSPCRHGALATRHAPVRDRTACEQKDRQGDDEAR